MNDYQPNLQHSSESYSGNDSNLRLAGWSETYVQDSDCVSDSVMDIQQLHLQAVDGGGGHFIVIKTDRWALDLDQIDAFAAQLKNFANRNTNKQNPCNHSSKT